MKLSIPISIIIASVVLVIGYFGMEYYETYKVRQMCDVLNEDYNYSDKDDLILKCIYSKS